MWLRKSKVPGAAPGGLVWQSLDDTVEVPDLLGAELLAIRDAGFSQAPPPAVEPDEEPEAAVVPPDDGPQGAAAPEAEVVEAPVAPRRGRPRKNPVDVAE
jgi:hypothetical protein